MKEFVITSAEIIGCPNSENGICKIEFNQYFYEEEMHVDYSFCSNKKCSYDKATKAKGVEIEFKGKMQEIPAFLNKKPLMEIENNKKALSAMSAEIYKYKSH